MSEPNRTPQEYAIEHAGYLATAATEFMAACNAFDEAREKHEDAEERVEAAAAYDVLYAAQEARSDAWSALRNAVYEFEKRRDRAGWTPEYDRRGNTR